MLFCRAKSNIFVYDCCSSRLAEGPDDHGIGLDRKRREELRDYALTIAGARVGSRSYTHSVNGTLLSRSLLPLLGTAAEMVLDTMFAITDKRLRPELKAAVARDLEQALPC